jgi:uncharacterized protein (DUF1778 family)
MPKKSNRALRQAGFKMPRMETVSLRIQPDLWEKCDWAAAAMKVDRSEFVRDTLADATRDAKPPVPRQFRGIEGTPAQVQQWEKAAALLEKPIDQFAIEAMDYAAKRLLQPKPAADTKPSS